MNTSNFLGIVTGFVASIILVLPVHAAVPDGAGPWADSVVTSSQGNTKGGNPVSTVNPARSDPTSAVGVAENDTVDSHFFSLGFGGSITLSFDNPMSNGVIIVEATNPEYPLERANVELSSDGTTWLSAGSVVQDGSVSMPEGLTCAKYVRITDASNQADFTEDTADGYDVDGVQATEGEPCTVETPTVTPSPSPTPGDSNNNNSSSSNNSSTPKSCDATKPPAPTLLSVNRTSGTTAELAWSAVSPVTHYAISYGTNPGNYTFGVSNTGNVTSFVVGGLDPNATYYFVVRAANDCMPGDPSGEKSTGGVLGASTGGQVLGASTDTLAATGSFDQVLQLTLSVGAAIATFVGGVILQKRHEIS